MRVAVIGSGPSASYAAEELLSQRGLAVEVDMFERLPTPGGLVRYGVAPDHQDTKLAAGAFAQTMRRKGFRLLLNVEVGRDVAHAQLLERYHAVVYAVGASSDRSLGIPGEDLPGSHAATDFVAWYNGHPDHAHHTYDLAAERAVVLGNGNVALDVARVLASDPARLARTDIADHALTALRASRIREVVVVGRRGPAQAAFTTPELLGLADCDGVDLVVRPDELGGPAAPGTAGDLKTELLAELGTRTPRHDRRVTLRFAASPTAVLGDGWVEGVRLVRNEVVEQDGRVVARPTADVEELACGLVLRAVGYHGRPVPDLPFDEVRGVVPHDGGRVLATTGGAAVPQVYVTGWIKRGASGVIGTNKVCARETVGRLLDDFAAGRLPAPVADAATLPDLLPEHVGLAGWRAIDQHEKRSGRAERRPRVKLVDVPALLAVARGEE
nr:FAD-dependent oxidoreductase [Nocardioides zeae]